MNKRTFCLHNNCNARPLQFETDLPGGIKDSFHYCPTHVPAWLKRKIIRKEAREVKA